MSNALKRRLISSSAIVAVLCLGSTDGAFADQYFAGLGSDGTALQYDDNTESSALISTSDGTSTALPTGTYGSYYYALSGDGKTAVGTIYELNSFPIIWNNGNSTILDFHGEATAVSTDGLKVAGTYNSPQAFYYDVTQAQTTFLDANVTDGPSGDSYAYAISGDGNTVAGEAYRTNGNGDNHAFVWDVQANKFTDIDSLYSFSEAYLVSQNGSVVAGYGTDYHTSSAFRWTSAGGMVDLGSLAANNGVTTAVNTQLSAMSADGNVLVGQSDIDDQNTSHAFRYLASTATMSDLGTLGGLTSAAYGLNTTGSVVVGTASDVESVNHGFRWTEQTGMLSVEQWLVMSGSSPLADMTSDAEYVSADGSVVIGETQSGTTYIARGSAIAEPTAPTTPVAPTTPADPAPVVTSPVVTSPVVVTTPTPGVGIIDTSEYLPTIATAHAAATQTNLTSADTVMFGAQGEPMRNLLTVGQKSVFGTIDGGYDNSSVGDGGLGLGEFGFGYGIADGVTARFAAGGTYNKQDLDAGGSVKQRGFYLSPEVTANVAGNVYATVGGYWGRGRIDSNRGYLNGGSQDYSDGDTNAETFGGKIRLDWLNAATVNNTAITPYAAFSYAHTKVDAFSEANGSFPVSYGESNDHATIARIGGDFVHPLTDSVRLLAKAEADYQFEDKSSGTNATIIGISNFELPGQDLQHFWLRGGLGGEFDVGKGTASLMVNATTKGQDADFWVRTSYSIKF